MRPASYVTEILMTFDKQSNACRAAVESKSNVVVTAALVACLRGPYTDAVGRGDRNGIWLVKILSVNWYVDDLTGALHVLKLRLSAFPPRPSSLAARSKIHDALTLWRWLTRVAWTGNWSLERVRMSGLSRRYCRTI